MARTKATGQVRAEDVTARMLVIDPEGNEASVVRFRRINHLEGELALSTGDFRVRQDLRLRVLPGS